MINVFNPNLLAKKLSYWGLEQIPSSSGTNPAVLHPWLTKSQIINYQRFATHPIHL
jgi:hypothetical protein